MSTLSIVEGMATYRYTNTSTDGLSLKLNERPLYGSSRLGSFRKHEELFALPTFSPQAANPIQQVDLNYELTDHLGKARPERSRRVTAVVTGRLLDGNGGGTPKQAELLSAQGYEAFGSLLSGRNYSSDSYRFGFQGQEKDDEMHDAVGTSINYKYRMHDPRIGRFLSIDPLTTKYPFYSPYAFSGNRVIDAVELEGLEPEDYKFQSMDKGLRLYAASKVGDDVGKQEVIMREGYAARAKGSLVGASLVSPFLGVGVAARLVLAGSNITMQAVSNEGKVDIVGPIMDALPAGGALKPLSPLVRMGLDALVDISAEDGVETPFYSSGSTEKKPWSDVAIDFAVDGLGTQLMKRYKSMGFEKLDDKVGEFLMEGIIHGGKEPVRTLTKDPGTIVGE